MNLYRQGKVPGSFYDGFGQEAVSVGAAFAMAAQDRLCILHRDLGAHLVRGVEPARILAQYMGRADGITRGRDGNVHFGDHDAGMRRDGLDAARHDARRHRHGDGVPHARRAALRDHLVRRRLDLARRLPRGDELGRRAAPAGHLRAREQPVRLLHAALDSSSSSIPSSAPRAYGFPGVRVDGNDVEAMFDATCGGARAGARRRRADAAGGGDDAHARPCRPRRHAATCPRSWSRSGAAATRSTARAARVAELGVDVDALREEVRRARSRRPPRRRCARRCPTRRPRPTGVFHDGDAVVLGDGDAPYSGFRSA